MMEQSGPCPVRGNASCLPLAGSRRWDRAKGTMEQWNKAHGRNLMTCRSRMRAISSTHAGQTCVTLFIMKADVQGNRTLDHDNGLERQLVSDTQRKDPNTGVLSIVWPPSASSSTKPTEKMRETPPDHFRGQGDLLDGSDTAGCSAEVVLC